ncbi:MAG: 1,4-alpha-glucan branching enzyme [Lentisphaerae bacterium GWF2_52_8]|nr:MAG: 1,4-alpha-glucan branching enzyme [Lentisphaerae bacterium GWF2_52_8]
MSTNNTQDNGLLPNTNDLLRVLEGRHTDPHSVLGMHFDKTQNAIIVRCLDPQAGKVFLVDGKEKRQLDRIHPDGLFAIKFADRKTHFPYRLEKHYNGKTFTSDDPYSFLPGLGEMDIYLFNEGEHRRVYDVMGAHPRTLNGISGVLFAVWAPNADRVSVVGHFNNWDGRRHQMRMIGSSGVWELFIPGLQAGDMYKFELRAKNGDVFLKQDPYSFQTELRPRTASIVPSDNPYGWTDHKWMEARKGCNWLETPMSIYEVHLSSWRGPGLRPIDPNNEDDFHSYRDLAHALANYVEDMGYTHIQLLPILEHPFDLSWGYQVTGFYAPTSRYGSPEDFAYFVDYMHNRGIGVMLDWVPAHFPKDDFSLGRFDGTALYEHADPRQGEHRDWGTYIFNYGRNEVRNFLAGSAMFWLDRFHIDGLRVDAVASMLYLDYSRENGGWIPNKYGGNENLEAISFIKRLNEMTHEFFPGSLMIAEESTAWPMVSRPVYLGGLGFSCKWNMGWMHDTLEYFSKEPIYRSYHHGTLTFSMLYAFTENFILPLSHDEVVHGKCSILSKMPGDYAQKFANLRALYAYMTAHPGKKLLFMGGEFGQWIEWNSKNGLDWNLLDYPAHHSLQTMLKDLNRLYRYHAALWEDDFTPNGFEWIDGGDYQQCVLSFVRWDKKHKAPLLIVANLTPIVREHYCVGVPRPGNWIEVFNSDHHRYGGTNLLNEGTIGTKQEKHHGREHSIQLRLPWLSVVILKPA